MLPAEATELLGTSLTQLEQQPSAGLVLTVVGFALALWASTSAMTTYMAALNTAYDREDGRSFVSKRLVAVTMVAAIGAAVGLVAVLLVFGPFVERWLGGVLGLEGVFGWIWWVAQWPVLVAGLLCAFAVLDYFGPDVNTATGSSSPPDRRRAGRVDRVSGLFAVYTSLFDSFNKTWGSLSAVIVTLTWLWLTGLALLFGGEVNAEVERTRELRQATPAGQGVLAPAPLRLSSARCRRSTSGGASRPVSTRAGRSSASRSSSRTRGDRRRGRDARPAGTGPPRAGAPRPGLAEHGGLERLQNLLRRLDRKRVWGELTLSTHMAPRSEPTAAQPWRPRRACPQARRSVGRRARAGFRRTGATCCRARARLDRLPRAGGAPGRAAESEPRPGEIALRFRVSAHAPAATALHRACPRCFERMGEAGVTGRLASCTRSRRRTTSPRRARSGGSPDVPSREQSSPTRACLP